MKILLYIIFSVSIIFVQSYSLPHNNSVLIDGEIQYPPKNEFNLGKLVLFYQHNNYTCYANKQEIKDFLFKLKYFTKPVESNLIDYRLHFLDSLINQLEKRDSLFILQDMLVENKLININNYYDSSSGKYCSDYISNIAKIFESGKYFIFDNKQKQFIHNIKIEYWEYELCQYKSYFINEDFLFEINSGCDYR